MTPDASGTGPARRRCGEREPVGIHGLAVSRSLLVPQEELRWRFSTSGGPGGQHANVSNTRVELTFDVARSKSLGPRQRAKLLARLGPVVRVVASDQRSQAQNRRAALARLRSRLEEALKSEPRRVPTAPSKRSQLKRLEDKRRRGELKRQRRPTAGE